MIAPRQVKVVSHMHVNNSNMAKTNIKTIIYKIVAKRFQHIFWVSDSSYNSYIFKKSVEKKSSILFNVVDKKPIVERSKFAELQENYDIIFIGRMQYQKNPEKLINVFKILKDKYNSDFSAAVIGEGPLYEETCKKVEQFGLRENVKMLGFVKNPMGLLKRAKVMLLTSRFEGTPMCALEAMALGVPIVSTPTDGMIDSQMVLAVGHFKQTQTSAIIEAVLNLSISIIVVFKFGLIGVAVGTIIAVFYRTIYFVWYLSKYILKRKISIFIKQTFIDILSVICIYFSTKWVALGNISYLSWMVMAIKIGIISLIIVVIISLVFSRKIFLSILKEIINIGNLW